MPIKKPKEIKNKKQVITVPTETIVPSGHYFATAPIWKILLRMAVPSMIIMLVMGGYMFSDTILAINFAPDSYKDLPGLTAVNQVTLAMNYTQPINSLMSAMALLFGVGIATRVAINLGAKRHERAISTLQTGFMSAIAVSIIAVPILILVAKPWIGHQAPEQYAGLFKNYGFKFIWIIILSFPSVMFNQVISSMLRNEGRNRAMMVAMISPIFVNLFLDWIFMGPGKMGIEGGAWATLISNVITSLLLLFFISKSKHDAVLRFRNLVGKNYAIIALFGIVMVGIAPFFRNFSQVITSSFQQPIIVSVSNSVYHDPLVMSTLMSKTYPVFMLFFPVMFSFSQSASPVASYNYGAKNYDRVRKTFFWTISFALAAAAIIYVLAVFALGRPLLGALRATSDEKSKAMHIMMILMISLPVYAFAIGAMTIFGSTDRLFGSLVASSLQGLVLFWPFVYGFKEIALHSSYDYAFWWYLPLSNLTASVVTGTMVVFTMLSLSKKPQTTLDEKIEFVRNYFAEPKDQRKVFVQRHKESVAKAKAEFLEKYNKEKLSKQNKA